jgi:hypothetical protein
MRRAAVAAAALAAGLAAPPGCAAPSGPAATVPQPPREPVGIGAVPGLIELLANAPDGEVALVLPPVVAGRPHRIALARRCAAAPAAVHDVLARVEDYPRTVPQVESAVVLVRAAEFVEFELELELPFQNLVYGLRYEFAAPLRIDVWGTSGALAGGRWSWELLPDDARGGTVVLYTSESEIGADAGLMLRRALAVHPDMEEGLAIAQGLRFLRSVCDAAEQGTR